MDVIRNYTLFLFGVMPMNAQNQTENLTIHHKVKDYAARTTLHGVRVTMTMRRPATRQASPMAEYSEAPKTPMMS